MSHVHFRLLYLTYTGWILYYNELNKAQSRADSLLYVHVCESTRVCVRWFRLCVLFQWSLNNVSMQHRSEAIPDTSLLLTIHQQNCIPSLPLSLIPSLSTTASLSPSVSSSSTHGESSQAVVHQGGQREMKLCIKEKPRQ